MRKLGFALYIFQKDEGKAERRKELDFNVHLSPWTETKARLSLRMKSCENMFTSLWQVSENYLSSSIKVQFQVGFISRQDLESGAQIRHSSKDFDWGGSHQKYFLTWYKNCIIFCVLGTGRISLLHIVLDIFFFDIVNQCFRSCLRTEVAVDVFQSWTEWLVADRIYVGGGNSIYSSSDLL